MDVTLQTADRLAFIEIKTSADARLALREAVGQLLEYAYFEPVPGRQDPEPFVVAPGPITHRATAYLRELESRGLLIKYRSFNLSESTIDI